MIETLSADDADRLLHHRRRRENGIRRRSGRRRSDDGCVTMSGSSASTAVDLSKNSRGGAGGEGGRKIENCGGEHDGETGERGSSDTKG